MLSDVELEALMALEALADDEADYVAVAREKVVLLCRALRGSSISIAAAHTAEKADRLERTVDEFARHNEALRQRSEAMQERYRALRQDLLEVRASIERLDAVAAARRAGLRDPGGAATDLFARGFEACQESVLERLDEVPLVALTDTPVDRFVDLNALEHRIQALEQDLSEERESRTWLLERMNALGLALGLRSHLGSPDKLLRQALRLEAIALAAEQLLGRLRAGRGGKSEDVARALGLDDAAGQIDSLAAEIERWRTSPDTMTAEIAEEPEDAPSSDGDDRE